MIRPRGRPPMPSATSRAIDPVGITSIGARVSSPSRMTAPLPCCRSICASAVVSALSRSKPAMDAPLDLLGRTSATLRVGSDSFRAATPPVDACAALTVGEHLFDSRRHAMLPGLRRIGPATSGEAARGSGVGAPRQAAKPPETSVAVGDRYLEMLADCSPDVLGRLTLGERLMDGSVAEPADHLVAGHRVGVGGTEPGVHPLPELRQPHGIP